ncbi:hypothetical protein VB773_17260 [Haloarculaceae archaeon H-GB2-1]|nr:hypothetical protein [Haloarculaceae archaeon H-GB1-1]MEA5387660.1 hypothetical protein [Haloarculaceae archaeon H-GB11]MEA5409146.1 hypothetical protein [Haloarculaceae archaeon H-GB2-1]
MTTANASVLNRASIVSTIVDAALAFVRGRPGSGLLLLGAAALSTRVPGLGTAVSLLLRVARRFGR